MAVRRSGRQRKSNVLYNSLADLDFSDSDGNHSEGQNDQPEATGRRKRPSKRDEDADFDILRSDVVNSIPDNSDDYEDDDSDGNGDGASSVSPLSGSGESSEGDQHGDADSDDSDEFLKTLSRAAILNPGQRRQRDSDDSEDESGDDRSGEENLDAGLYCQAIYHISKAHRRSRILHYSNGQDTNEIELLYRMMSRSAKDATIPARCPDKGGHGGLLPSPLVPDSQRCVDAERTLWFSKLVQSDRFMHKQKTKSLSAAEELRYTPPKRSLTLLAVPNPDEKVRVIDASVPIHLDDLWTKQSTFDRSAKRDCAKDGWLLNVSENVQCVGWMPSIGHDVQYLAVSCRPEPSLAWDPDVQDKPPYTAFEPGASGPSCIDLWKFETRNTGVEGVVTLSRDPPPTRLLSLCTNFGPLVEFKWCPKSLQSKKKGPFGLLATLHDDGALRIFALDLPQHSHGQQTQRLLLEHPSFESRPRQTILTCIEWISPYLISAGCADGHVAVWDIQAHYDEPSPPKSARPMFYEPLHLTYVTMISPCAPSHPHLLISSAIDGSMRVTDLRDPQSDTAEGTRARTPSGIAQWYEWMQCVLTIDEMPRLRMNPLRHVETAIKMNRFDAAVASMATSPLHGSLLTATIDGIVAITCPANSWFRSKRRWHVLRQLWIKHEWRAGRMVPAADGDGETPLDFPGGLTRLSTGYKVQDLREVYRQDLERERQLKKRKRHSKKGKGMAEDDLGESRATEVHDKKTSTKALAWNPNQCAGGWAAVGMGDGLLWVEDLCYE